MPEVLSVLDAAQVESSLPISARTSEDATEYRVASGQGPDVRIAFRRGDRVPLANTLTVAFEITTPSPSTTLLEYERLKTLMQRAQWLKKELDGQTRYRELLPYPVRRVTKAKVDAFERTVKVTFLLDTLYGEWTARPDRSEMFVELPGERAAVSTNLNVTSKGASRYEDDFSAATLEANWSGDVASFTIVGGKLRATAYKNIYRNPAGQKFRYGRIKASIGAGKGLQKRTDASNRWRLAVGTTNVMLIPTVGADLSPVFNQASVDSANNHVYELDFSAAGIDIYRDGVKLNSAIIPHNATLDVVSSPGVHSGSEVGPDADDYSSWALENAANQTFTITSAGAYYAKIGATQYNPSGGTISITGLRAPTSYDLYRASDNVKLVTGATAYPGGTAALASTWDYTTTRDGENSFVLGSTATVTQLQMSGAGGTLMALDAAFWQQQQDVLVILNQTGGVATDIPAGMRIVATR